MTHTWNVSTQERLKQPEFQSEFDTRLDGIIVRSRVWEERTREGEGYEGGRKKNIT